MSNLILQIGHSYRAKEPKERRGFYNDRVILYISSDGNKIQYSSNLSTRWGCRHPVISREKFLQWAGSDITDQLPKDVWEKLERWEKWASSHICKECGHEYAEPLDETRICAICSGNIKKRKE